MSDSSYYETREGSSYENSFPGPSVTGSRNGKEKPIRSKFREEFGEAAPDQPPRLRIGSKLRGISHQGQPPAGPKRSGEVITNHIFLSDYDPEDVQAHRNSLYHRCPQAAESTPEGWQQSLGRRNPSVSDSYPAETQSVKELKTFANEPWVAYQREDWDTVRRRKPLRRVHQN